MSKKEVGNEAIYDAIVLGTPKMLVLGFQHLFAMFGATVLVPIITGLSVSTTLLFAGIATLFMHFVTGRKVPVFLGSSFAFLGGYAAVKQIAVASGYTEQQGLVYACLGVACAGLMYLILSFVCKAYGSKKVMRFFPPIVTGPIIMCVGLHLAPSAIDNCNANWGIALVAIAVVIICNIWAWSRSSPSCWACWPPTWWPPSPATWISAAWPPPPGSASPCRWTAPCSPCSAAMLTAD